MTLKLNKVTTAPATLTVERDTAAVTDAVNNFAKSYNELYSAMRNSVAYKSKSSLEGDATLRSMQTQMRSIASSAASGGTMTNLYEIGITFKVDGTMQVDSAKLDSAMAANFSDVTNLLKGTTGYATKYEAWAIQELSVGGSIASRTDGLNKYIKDIGTQREIMESRMTRLEKQYRTQYSIPQCHAESNEFNQRILVPATWISCKRGHHHEHNKCHQGIRQCRTGI